ncbi:MAG: hypothetical protein ACFFDY_01025 [Candidatus Thorarchaeota archaeon]
MLFQNNISFDNCIGTHTLLYGETNTNKTYYTGKFIQFLIESKKINPKEISILDFAPPLSIIRNNKIGGKIEDYYKNSALCNNYYFQGEIIPPRLKAMNIKDLYKNACNNFKKTYKLLKIFNDSPAPILIINDISIYLHVGNKKLLIDSIKKANTFFGNTYYGSSIRTDFTSLFSLREKRLVEYLVKKINNSYFTG